MKRIALLAAALVAALVSTLSAQGTFRTGVDVVSLNVTAVDTSNQLPDSAKSALVAGAVPTVHVTFGVRRVRAIKPVRPVPSVNA